MKDRGFTLIELLAVIVILAIIALIAVPIILNIINDSKKQSGMRSAELYLKAAELAIARKNLTTELGDTTCSVVPATGNLSCTTSDNNIDVEVEMDGTKPNSGSIVFSNGKVTGVTELSFPNGDSYNLENGKLVLNTPKEATKESCFIYQEKEIISYEGIDVDKCASTIKQFFISVGEDISDYDDTYFVGICRNENEDYSLDDILEDPSLEQLLYKSGALNDVVANDVSETSVLKYICSDKDVIIPGTLGGKPVTAIGDDSFADRELTSIIIPNGVKTIGEYAFAYNRLKGDLIIPDSVVSIGNNAFFSGTGSAPSESNQLTGLTIGNKVEYIGERAFYGNALSGHLSIPSSVTTIGEYAFCHNNLTSVAIPNSITRITYAEFGDNQLTSVYIDRYENDPGLTIEQGAFSWADGYTDENIKWKTN